MVLLLIKCFFERFGREKLEIVEAPPPMPGDGERVGEHYGATGNGGGGFRDFAAAPRCGTHEPVVVRRPRLSWARIAASTLSAGLIAGALLGCLLVVLPPGRGDLDQAELAVKLTAIPDRHHIRPPLADSRPLINGYACKCKCKHWVTLCSRELLTARAPLPFGRSLPSAPPLQNSTSKLFDQDWSVAVSQ
jgi:hypothetical protein